MIKGKKGLMSAYEDAFKDTQAKQGFSVMNYPVGIEKFEPKEDKRNKINIIPYIIKTKNHPRVVAGTAEVGDMDFKYAIRVHRNFNGSEVCLSSFGQPCPICEKVKELRSQGDTKNAEKLKVSDRFFVNVEDLTEPGKIKVFETSNYSFGNPLIKAARDDDGGFVNFCDPEDGKVVRFRAEKQKKVGMEFFEYSEFNFMDREEPLDEKLVKDAISFDECVKLKTYDELKSLVDNISLSSQTVSDESVNDESSKEEESDDTDNCEKCPFKHTFAKDCDKFDDCDECDNYGECRKAKKSLK